MFELILALSCEMTKPDGTVVHFEFCGQEPSSIPAPPSNRPSATRKQPEPDDTTPTYYRLTDEHYRELKQIVQERDPDGSLATRLYDFERLFGRGKVIQQATGGHLRYEWTEGHRRVEGWFKNGSKLTDWKAKGF